MLSAIYLDDDTRFEAYKIDNVFSKGLLSAELETFDLALAKHFPQVPLRFGHVRTKFAGALFLPCRHQLIITSEVACRKLR